MANQSYEQDFQKSSRPQLIPLIKFALEMNRQAREQEMLRYTNACKNTKKRNRFQRFFYRLSVKLQRACSSIENEKARLRGKEDDL